MTNFYAFFDFEAPAVREACALHKPFPRLRQTQRVDSGTALVEVIRVCRGMAWRSARRQAVALVACSLVVVALARRPLQEPTRTPVAMCLAVKDEHADLREWIEHHR